MADGKKRAINEARIRAFITMFIESVKAGSVEEHQRADRLAELVNQQIQNFLNGWQEQAYSALMVANKPADKDSVAFFYIALAGNLLWAGTCLVSPEFDAASLFMSVSGAVSWDGSV